VSLLSRVVGHFRAIRDTAARSGPPSAGYAGEAYLSLILELLAEETRTRDLIERRAVGVLAAIAVIVTVLATLADSAPLAGVRVAQWASFLGAESGLLLFWSGAFAWLTIVPRRYEVAAIDDLSRIVATPEYWAADVTIGTRRAAESHLGALASARQANGHKAWLLTVAMGLALLGVTLLAAAAFALARGS
jgi:hypothetical protein